MIERRAPLFDRTSARFMAGFSLLLLSTTALAAEAGDNSPPEGPAKNCVDRCIIDFAAKRELKVSEADLLTAIDAIGLDRSATFRSLDDCLRIMAAMGLHARAVPFAVEPTTQYPPLSIINIPPNSDVARPGHMVVVTTHNGTDLEIFDPSARVETTRAKAEAVTGTHETIAIIPETTYLATLARGLSSSLGLSAILGLVIALPLVLSMRKRAAMVGAKPAAALILAAVSLELAGCRRPVTPAGVKVESLRHDFGVISGNRIPDAVSYSFRLRNDATKSVTITPAASSCSCVLVAAQHDGLRLAPGQADEIAVSVRLGQKTGPFRESVFLRTEPESVASPRQLGLVGFVSRGPVPSATSMRFQVADGELQTSELEVVYARRPGGLAAQLVAARIEGDGAAWFQLGPSRQHVGTTISASLADVWRFPVTYHREGGSTQDRAQIRLSFDEPKCELNVDLHGRWLSPVEPLGQRKHYQGLAVGVAHEEKVYLRVRDRNAAGSVSIQCPPDIVSGSYNEKSRTVLLTIRPDHAGDFSRQVDILFDGRPVSKLDITGTAN